MANQAQPRLLLQKMRKENQGAGYWQKKYEEEKRDKKFFQKKLEEANLRILKLLEEKKEG